MKRVYLDHNATTPLRVQAREAMMAAMDVVGNPSSVHAEGRAAKGLIERARAQVAALVGCKSQQVVFTGSATEAAALAVAQKDQHGDVFGAFETEHDCLLEWSDVTFLSVIGRDGNLQIASFDRFANQICKLADSDWQESRPAVALVAQSAANSETGIMAAQHSVVASGSINASRQGAVAYSVVCDITQMAGKVPVTYSRRGTPAYMILSAHKLGGPKGVGALINFTSQDPKAALRGGGQEMGRRCGTENVVGIAGFGAAAQAAAHDVESGAWARVEKLRNILENALEAPEKETIFVGKDAPRLPNTSCIVTPGWKGETQVMQMDLAGFAVSSGSACSSGKVKASRVLQAMGYSQAEASSAIRVSLGLDTTEEDVLRFADCWRKARQRHKTRAA